MRQCECCKEVFDEDYAREHFHNMVFPTVLTLCEVCWEEYGEPLAERVEEELGE